MDNETETAVGSGPQDSAAAAVDVALLLGEGSSSDSDESSGGLGVAKVLNFMNMNHLPHAIFGRQTPRSAEPAPEPVRVVTITKALSKHARRTVSGKEVEGKGRVAGAGARYRGASPVGVRRSADRVR